MADLLFEEEFGSAKKMRVFTEKTLVDHLKKTTVLHNNINDTFDSPKMRKLHGGTFRVPKALEG
jgi:hypothetical protein